MVERERCKFGEATIFVSGCECGGMRETVKGRGGGVSKGKEERETEKKWKKTKSANNQTN